MLSGFVVEGWKSNFCDSSRVKIRLFQKKTRYTWTHRPNKNSLFGWPWLMADADLAGWCWFGVRKNIIGKLQQNRVKVDLVPLINNTSINNQSSEHVFEFWRPENIERGGDTYTAALPLLRCTMENGGCARLARIESCSAITTTNYKSVRCQLITLPCFSQFDFYLKKNSSSARRPTARPASVYSS